MFSRYRKLWYTLAAFIILSPLGLLATGTAFGEWGLEELQEQFGFVPAGLARFADLWHHSLLPDYSLAGMDASFTQSALGYILSAAVGIALVIGITSLLVRLVKD